MGAIDITFSQSDYKKLQDMLGRYKSEAPKVLKTALNETAKQTKTILAKKARETYTIKSSKFKKNIRQYNATTQNLEADLKVSGSPQKISYFTTRNNTKKTSAKAKVRQDKSLKAIISQTTGNKAFAAEFKMGGKNQEVENAKTHKAIAQRVGKARYPIKEFYSLSDPAMVGSKSVYGSIEKEIQEKLHAQVMRQVRRMMA